MPPSEDVARSTDVRTVLHVLTTAYQVGGHTRLAWRWIERDDGRVHSVALTRQAYEPLPTYLPEVVRARRGRIHRIDKAAGGLLGRAAALQAVAARADLVVMHTHPFDVVPPIALAGLDRDGRRPPTILLNHADHLFWIGLSIADLVLHLRASGARLSSARRALPPKRSGILPVPLSPAPSALDRESSRRALGLSNTDVLALSVASGYKFSSARGDGLLPLLEQALGRRVALRVLAVGPGGRTDWREASTRTSRRLGSMGIRDDIPAMYGSADIYLDSFPFSSLTSMLEAGQHGLPLVAYANRAPGADVLGFDDPAIEGLAIQARTDAEYLAAIEKLVDDPALRLESGRRIQRAIAADHEGQGWREHLERAYRQATSVHFSPRVDSLDSGADPIPGQFSELDRRLLTLMDAQQEDAPRGVRGYLRFAPFGVRLEEWRRSRGTVRPLSILVLLPELVLLLARRAAIVGRTGRRAVGHGRRVVIERTNTEAR